MDILCFFRRSVNVVIFLILSFSITVRAYAQEDWQSIVSVDQICNAYPDLMENMLFEFDLDYPGMKKVKQAYDSGDIKQACLYLLDYYKNSNDAMNLRMQQPIVTDRRIASADTVLQNIFVVQNVRGVVPYGEDGHRDWYYKGPNNDREWAWLSNRHSQLGQVLSAYFETGNPVYAEYIDFFLRDFIIKSMPYPAVKSSTSVWRGLEVAARAKVWSRIFYGLLNSAYLSPSTRLLMLSSLPDHAHYNRNFHGSNNWLTMEISALATVATNFPEYKQSNEWLEYAIATMTESMKGQVYPDGVQTELSSHYHNVALKNFELFQEICINANQPLPDFYNQTIEAMYSYIAHAVRPDGYRALNNDGDRGSDREIIMSGAKKYNNAVWEYIITNGMSGNRPSDGPSCFFPWAGQLISRSGYDTDAQWSFFDVGPWGSGHQHNDKLHISVSAYGRDLLVDAGRFAYTGEVADKFRAYAKGTKGHNSILIDGKGQESDVKVVEEPLAENHFKITPEYDYAWNSFDKYYDLENVKHTRALVYVRGNFWVVTDKIETDQAREIETFWHWHPESEIVKRKKRIVSTDNEHGNLLVIPVGKTKWKIDFIKGREVPEIQGWYSPEYNKFEPNVASVYTADIKADKTFVWLLIPFESEAPKLKAKIIARNLNGVKLKISDREKGKWVLFVPYNDSREAALDFTAVSDK